MAYSNSTADRSIELWSPEEDALLQELQREFGNKWQRISEIMAKQHKAVLKEHAEAH